jgi:hypothetical protein
VIGAEKHDAGPEYPSFRGWIDEVRISRIIRYRGAFTPPTAPFTPDPDTVALYHFNEGAGVTVRDSSGAPGGPSDGALRVGGSPAGPAWSEDTPWIGSSASPTFTDTSAGTGCASAVAATIAHHDHRCRHERPAAHSHTRSTEATDERSVSPNAHIPSLPNTTDRWNGCTLADAWRCFVCASQSAVLATHYCSDRAGAGRRRGGAHASKVIRL